MDEDINQRLIARIRARERGAGASRAVAMEPQVRTPIDIVPAKQPQRLKLESLDPIDGKSPLCGPYLFEWQYNVRFDSVDAFHDWLSLYEEPLRTRCPSHFRYLGTFQALFGPSAPAESGRYRTLWQHKDLAGTLHILRSRGDDEVDGQKGEASDPDEDLFLKLLREFISFQDTGGSSVRSNQLFQLVTSR